LADSGEHIGLDDAYTLKPYGIGIDTHKKFIQVCVLLRQEGGVKRVDRTFSTAWASLCEARDYAEWVLNKHGCPEAIEEFEAVGLRYCGEAHTRGCRLPCAALSAQT